MNVTFSHSEDTASGIKSYYFKPEKRLRYIAGQFIELHLPHEVADSRGDKRWFTLSSTPSDEFISITTALAGDQSSSFKRKLSELTPGSAASISLPMGDFVLPKDKSIPLIFVAGGIGITPFKSIITELQNRGEHRNITLLYASYSEEQVAFRQTFEKLNDKYISLITGGEGLLTAQTIVNLTRPTKEHYIYVSGSEAMVETLVKEIAAQNIERRHIFTDYFHGYVES